jgi:hypothetical protein
MYWERDPLWAKARLFFEYALACDRDDPRFGLWCAFGLEVLAKAAISTVSPVLIAEPDHDHRHLLHALGLGDPKVDPQSLGAAQSFLLCKKLFSDFTAEHVTAARALVNRRNAELHSGQSAFNDYTTQHWIAGFYGCCRALVVPLQETLESLLGADEAAEADRVLAVNEQEARHRVQERIGRYRGVFADKQEAERDAAAAQAALLGEQLARQQHHRASCPACRSVGTLQGDVLGAAKVEHGDDNVEIVVKQAIAPRKFSCPACGLKLEGYAELAIAGLADQYTRTGRYSPAEYYELIDPEDYDEIAEAAERLGFSPPQEQEYDNE